MDKFNNIYKVLLEAVTDEEEELDSLDPEEEEGDINFDTEDQGLPEEMDMEMGDAPAAAQTSTLNTPQDLELAKLAVKALEFNGRLNEKIFSDFEEKGNSTQILNYVESKLGIDTLTPEELEQFDTGEEMEAPIESPEGEEELGEEGLPAPEGEMSSSMYDPEQLNGKRIGDRLSYYNQQSEGYTDQQIDFWTRIILNALQYEGEDYNVDPSNVTAATVEQLKQDFNHSTSGMFNNMIKDRPTGANIKGPGVF